MTRQEQLILESPRLQLRNLKESDLVDFLHYRSRPEVARYQFWEPFDEKKSIEYILAYKDSVPGIPGEWFQLGIVLKSENKLIGDCAIKQDKDEPRKADIGCSLSPDYQGNGYAREALTRLLDYYFRVMGLHRAVGIADSKNHRAVRLMEGLHMRREGHFIKNIWFKGEWGDEYAYAVLKEEWPSPGRGDPDEEILPQHL